MGERIEFLATIPDISGAIKGDGGKGEGGRLVLEIPGTDLDALKQMFDVRGEILRVVVEVVPRD